MVARAANLTAVVTVKVSPKMTRFPLRGRRDVGAWSNMAEDRL